VGQAGRTVSLDVHAVSSSRYRGSLRSATSAERTSASTSRRAASSSTASRPPSIRAAAASSASTSAGIVTEVNGRRLVCRRGIAAASACTVASGRVGGPRVIRGDPVAATTARAARAGPSSPARWVGPAADVDDPVGQRYLPWVSTQRW
jgi:hypothetical protein